MNHLRIKKYQVIRADRSANKDLLKGEFVYDRAGHDYGLASMDSLSTGIEHISVTFDPKGEPPGFTIPKQDLQEVEHV